MTQALRLEWLNADDLEDNPSNWRTHPDHQADVLADLISEVGWAGVLLFNETTGHLIDGHLRKKVAAGTIVPVVIGAWSEADEMKILATLDPVGAMATADKAKLDELIQRVQTESQPVAEMLASLQSGFEHLTLEAGKAWNPEIDTTGEHAVDVVGYDLGSVWMRDSNIGAHVYSYLLPLPANPQKSKPGALTVNYSRSPALEMQWIVNTYMRSGDYFMENCAGWFTFSMTAALAGYSGEGVDLWDTSLAFGRKQIDNLPDGCGSVKQVKGDARALPYPDDHFDFAYVNPPFYQLETYSNDPADLSKAPTLADWLRESTAMLDDMRRVVKPGSLIVTVMADYRDAGDLVPFKCTDPMAQDLLWEYARRRRSVDPEFADDLQEALRIKGFDPLGRKR